MKFDEKDESALNNSCNLNIIWNKRRRTNLKQKDKQKRQKYRKGLGIDKKANIIHKKIETYRDKSFADTDYKDHNVFERLDI